MASFQTGQCRDCASFNNEAGFVEQMLPGLSSLSSAYAAVRSDDGICGRDDRLRSAHAGCSAFTARTPDIEPALSQSVASTALADPWLQPWSF